MKYISICILFFICGCSYEPSNVSKGKPVSVTHLENGGDVIEAHDFGNRVCYIYSKSINCVKK